LRIGSFQLSRGGAYFAGLALGLVALLWVPLAFIASGAAATSDVSFWNHFSVLAPLGLFPAWGTWALFDWIRHVEAEASFNAPVAPTSEPTKAAMPEPTKAVAVGPAKPLTVLLAAVSMLGLLALQLAVVLLFVGSKVISDGPSTGAVMFLMVELSPVVVGGFLVWSLIQRSRSAWFRVRPGLGRCDRLVRGSLLLAAVVLVSAEVAWSAFNTVLALAVTWGGLDFNIFVLALINVPCLILLAVARRTASAAFEMTPV
jgi:hypothetical protein